MKKTSKIIDNYSIDNFADLAEFFHIQKDQPEFRKKTSVRLTQKLAKNILLNNQNIIIDGRVNYFKIKNLGLGVFEIELNKEGKETVLVK